MKRWTRGAAVIGAALCLGWGMTANAGRVSFQFYGGPNQLGGQPISGAAVSDLIDADEFPDNPVGGSGETVGGGAFTFPYLDQGLQFPPDFAEDDTFGSDYGTKTEGYIYVPAGGEWRFFVRSDDASRLELNLNGPEPSGREVIAEEPDCCNAFMEDGTRSSDAFMLEPGQGYYFRMLHKEATGADWWQVGWRGPNMEEPEVVPARSVQTFAPESGVPTIDVPPQTITVNEGEDALFMVSATAHPPVTYTWEFGGTTVSDAVNPSLRIESASVADDGKEITVTVENGSGSVTSEAATLNVTPDTTPPVAKRASTRGNPNGVTVFFSEPVSEETALNSENYSIDGGTVPIEGAEFMENTATVRLNTGGPAFEMESDHTIEITDVEDRADDANVLDPNPTTLEFSFGKGRTVTYDFNEGQPDNLELFGSAEILGSGGPDGSGVLQLTPAENNVAGSAFFKSLGPVPEIEATFDLRIGGGSDPQADGMSFNLIETGAIERSANIWRFDVMGNEEGAGEGFSEGDGDGLTISFDNWDNSAQEESGNPDVTPQAPGLDIKWMGPAYASAAMGTQSDSTLDTGDNFIDVGIRVNGAGETTVEYREGEVIHEGVSIPWAAFEDGEVVFAARTGGATAEHQIDNLEVTIGGGEVGPVEITQQPQDATVTEGRDISFSVAVSGARPHNVEWFVGDQKIEGATGTTLNLTEVPLDFSGAEVTAQVSNRFSQTTSEAAILAVEEDTTPPAIEEIQGFAGGADVIRILFNEELDQATATDLANYETDGLSLNSASLSEDGREVSLTSGEQTFGQEHTLSIDGVADLVGNVVATEVMFASAFSFSRSALADDPVRYWRLDETSGDTAESVVSDEDDLSAAHGSYGGDPELGVEGLALSDPEDTAVNFDPGQNVDIPNGNDINVGGPYLQKTVEMWIRPDTILGPDQAQGLWEQGGGTRGIGLYLIEDEVFFNAWNNAAGDGPGDDWGSGSSGDPVFVGGGNLQAGMPAHIVAVMEGIDDDSLSGTLTLYVNGEQVAETDGVGQLFNHGGDVDIAEVADLPHTDVSGENLDGTIDEVLLYNTALSETQVRNHFEAGRTVPPWSVEISSPADGSSLPQEMTEIATEFSEVGDVQISRVEFFVDGERIGSVESSPFSLMWDATGGIQTVSVRAFDEIGRVDVAEISVVVDEAGMPSITDVQGGADLTSLDVGFSEVVTQDSVENTANYSITDGDGNTLEVQGATRLEDRRSVALTTGSQTSGTKYTVSVGEVVDVVGNPVNEEAVFFGLGSLVQAGDGTVSIEAESFTNKEMPAVHDWVFDNSESGFSGRGYMEATPNNDDNFSDPGEFTASSPRLDYEVEFNEAGTYYLWVRGFGASGGDDSVHVGLDEEPLQSSIRITGFGDGFEWANGRQSPSEGTPLIEVGSAGTHTVNVWMREDGFLVDKILLVPSEDFSPSGLGPDETREGVPSLPTGEIVSPAHLSSHSPGNVEIEVSASSEELEIFKINFLVNGQKVGEATSEPYTTMWNASGGVHSITAEVVDVARQSVGLGPVMVTVAEQTPFYPEEVLADDAVRYWRLDEQRGETAHSVVWDQDDQATANGTYTGGPELGVEGLALIPPENTAVNFDPGQNVDIPNGEDINVGGPYLQKTLEMWIQPDEILGTGQAQGLWEQGGGTRGIGLYLIENEVFMNVWNNATEDGPGDDWGSGSSGDPVFVGGGNVQAGQPAHIVGVMEGVANDDLSGTLKLYVNGELVDETDGAGQLFDHAGDVDLNEVGALIHTDVEGVNFNGTIDEVAHYNSALSEEQVKNHYEAAPDAPTVVPLSVDLDDGTVIVTWEGAGTLETATSVDGPWQAASSENQDGEATFSVSEQDQLFLRLVQ